MLTKTNVKILEAFQSMPGWREAYEIADNLCMNRRGYAGGFCGSFNVLVINGLLDARLNARGPQGELFNEYKISKMGRKLMRAYGPQSST